MRWLKTSPTDRCWFSAGASCICAWHKRSKNYTAIDWTNNASNYNDVVTQAANEAGGHGFVTERAGTTEAYRGVVFNNLDDDYADLAWDFGDLETVIGGLYTYYLPGVEIPSDEELIAMVE